LPPEGAAEQSEFHPRIAQPAREGAVRKKYKVTPLVIIIIEELEKLDAGLDGVGISVTILGNANLFLSARIEALVAKDTPVGGPFIFQSRRDHNDDRTRFGVAENHRTGDGKGDEGFAHTDLIRKDDPGPLVKTVEDGLGGDLLADGVFRPDAARTMQVDGGSEIEFQWHSCASLNARFT
jgi:hypothetical protein